MSYRDHPDEHTNMKVLLVLVLVGYACGQVHPRYNIMQYLEHTARETQLVAALRQTGLDRTLTSGGKSIS
jgi:hypothetical protein